jgi:tetratricopeptide (TPR) repeat protein
MNPQDAVLMNNLGSAYLAVGGSKEAIDLCQKALEIKPNFTLAFYNLGEALYL